MLPSKHKPAYKRGNMMEYAAIHHQPFSADAYSYDGRTVHIKIRTKKVMLIRFDWFGAILMNTAAADGRQPSSQ